MATLQTGKKRGRKPKLLPENINTNINDTQEDPDDYSEKDKNLIKKNNLIKERLITIDKILEMYPNLKKDRTTIVNNILNKKEYKIENFILEKIKIGDNDYYFDPNGNIIDQNINLVGFFVKNKENYGFYLFSDHVNNIKKIKKLTLEIINLKKLH